MALSTARGDIQRAAHEAGWREQDHVPADSMIIERAGKTMADRPDRIVIYFSPSGRVRAAYHNGDAVPDANRTILMRLKEIG